MVRTCGSCTLCCKVLGIDALDKHPHQWCGHCKKGQGCSIYADRPDECRTFDCGYLSRPDHIGDHWRPATSKMVICSNISSGRIEIHVDESRRDAWKNEPFYSEIKHWARAATDNGGQLLICQKDRTFVILPHRDIDLGKISKDERILTYNRQTPAGFERDAIKVQADDPRITSVTVAG